MGWTCIWLFFLLFCIMTTVETQTLQIQLKNSNDQSYDSDDEQLSEEEAGEIVKPKIFDNKNFVEAPLPSTNPWSKSAAPEPIAKIIKVEKENIDVKAGDFSDFLNWPALHEVKSEASYVSLKKKTGAVLANSTVDNSVQTSGSSSPKTEQPNMDSDKVVSDENENQSTSDSGGDDSSKENKE